MRPMRRLWLSLVLGVMLVLFVVGAPEGIIGLIGRVRRNRNDGEG